MSKHYGIKYAVNDVNITLKPGVYGLLGANGAGKTTLMRMICGILKPTSGRICLNGSTIDQLREHYYARLGYMPQDFGFYLDFTAREFMLYMAVVKGLDKKEAKKRIEELLELVNLRDVADKKIKSFSGGMKQRLGIAQTELNAPDILILDEPTAGLDPKERVRFRNLISDFAKKKTTHIVSDVSYIADTILMMKNGTILLQEPMATVTDCMNGKVRLRMIHETPPTTNAMAVSPNLEDLFLYHFGEDAGTDAVILSAKYGKTKLTTAKIIASYLFGVLAFTLHIVVALGLPLAAFGFDGWDLPLQIANTTIPYPLTFLQATLANLGVVYLVLFAMIGLTLLLSAKMKSPYLVLIVLVPVLFIPLFLSPNGTTGAYNLTLFLLPYRCIIPELGKYISHPFGGIVLDAFTMRAILYAMLTAITLPLARLGFKKHQVSA